MMKRFRFWSAASESNQCFDFNDQHKSSHLESLPTLSALIERHERWFHEFRLLLRHQIPQTLFDLGSAFRSKDSTIDARFPIVSTEWQQIISSYSRGEATAFLRACESFELKLASFQDSPKDVKDSAMKVATTTEVLDDLETLDPFEELEMFFNSLVMTREPSAERIEHFLNNLVQTPDHIIFALLEKYKRTDFQAMYPCGVSKGLRTDLQSLQRIYRTAASDGFEWCLLRTCLDSRIVTNHILIGDVFEFICCDSHWIQAIQRVFDPTLRRVIMNRRRSSQVNSAPSSEELLYIVTQLKSLLESNLHPLFYAAIQYAHEGIQNMDAVRLLFCDVLFTRFIETIFKFPERFCILENILVSDDERLFLTRIGELLKGTFLCVVDVRNTSQCAPSVNRGVLDLILDMVENLETGSFHRDKIIALQSDPILCLSSMELENLLTLMKEWPFDDSYQFQVCANESYCFKIREGKYEFVERELIRAFGRIPPQDESVSAFIGVLNILAFSGGQDLKSMASLDDLVKCAEGMLDEYHRLADNENVMRLRDCLNPLSSIREYSRKKGHSCYKKLVYGAHRQIESLLSVNQTLHLMMRKWQHLISTARAGQHISFRKMLMSTDIMRLKFFSEYIFQSIKSEEPAAYHEKSHLDVQYLPASDPRRNHLHRLQSRKDMCLLQFIHSSYSPFENYRVHNSSRKLIVDYPNVRLREWRHLQTTVDRKRFDRIGWVLADLLVHSVEMQSILYKPETYDMDLSKLSVHRVSLTRLLNIFIHENSLFDRLSAINDFRSTLKQDLPVSHSFDTDESISLFTHVLEELFQRGTETIDKNKLFSAYDLILVSMQAIYQLAPVAVLDLSLEGKVFFDFSLALLSISGSLSCSLEE